MGLVAIAVALLEDMGTLVQLVPGVASGTVAAACFAASFVALCTFLVGICRWTGDRAGRRWATSVLGALGWLADVAAGVVAAIAVLYALVSAPVTTATVASPDGKRSVLLAHQSLLLLGSIHAYEPAGWPIYREFGGLPIDDGFLPLSDADFTVEWRDDSLVYHGPQDNGRDGYTSEPVPLPPGLRLP